MRRVLRSAMVLSLATALAVLPAWPGFAPGGAQAQEATPTPAGEVWTPEEVAAATGNHGVIPVAAIPKKLKKRYLLAFINPGLNIPFFQEWSNAMKAAAEFYGVDLIESDMQLKWEDTVTHFNTLNARNPDIFGTLTLSTEAVKAAADAAGKPIIPIDIPIPGNPYFLGIPNAKAGQLGAELLGPAVKAKMEGEWKGRRLIYLGLSDLSCEPCETRINTGLETLRKYVDIPDENVIKLDRGGTQDPGRSQTADVLTANPTAVFAILSLNDEGGVGALQAVQAAGREQDALLVTLGADPLARTELRKGSPTYVGAIDFNPWAEGWNWVEAAIITLEGGTFQPYDIARAVTPQNVDQLFPDDPKPES